MKKRSVCIIILFHLLCFFPDLVSGQYIISFLPNPEGDDNNKEFIEIYTASLNMTGYIIGDSASNDTLTGLHYGNSTTAFIVEEGFAVTDRNVTFYSAGAAIGNSLGNTGDNIFLYTPNGTLLSSITYSEADEGIIYYMNKTDNDTINDIEHENITEQNDETEESEELINIISLSSVLPSVTYLNQTLTKGFSIKNLGEEKIDVLLQYTVFFNNTVLVNASKEFLNISRSKTADTIDITFLYEGNYTICGTVTVLSNTIETDFSDNAVCQDVDVIDLSHVLCDRNITIVLNQSHVKNKEKVSFSFLVEGDYALEDVPFAISYFIREYREDIVKQPVTTATTSTKYWTPEITTHYGLFILDATLIETTCRDTNSENNAVFAYIIVDRTLEEEASATIDHIYLGTDGIAKTGDMLRIKVTVYSGNLSRISEEEQGMKLFVKDGDGRIVSKTTELDFYESFQENTLIVPLLLDYSCTTFPITEEYYTLIVQSAGNTAKEKFPVRGVNTDRCSSLSSTEMYSASFTEIAYPLQNITQNLTLSNIDDIPHTYKISSKIYRGSKTYSGDFFENMQEHGLIPGEERTIYLENTVPDLSFGTYKVKITIEKDQQKTTKYIIRDLIVLDPTSVNQRVQNKEGIVSFFVVEQEIDEEMTVFAEIYGTGNYTLVLESIVEREGRELLLNNTVYLFFNMTVQKGKNIFVLTLYNTNEMIESVPLIVFVGDYDEDNNITKGIFDQSLQNSITGNTVSLPLGLSRSYYKSLSYIHGIVLLSLLFFVIVLALMKIPEQNMVAYISTLVNQKLFKTTSISAQYEESHQNQSDYRDARSTKGTYSRDTSIIHRQD